MIGRQQEIISSLHLGPFSPRKMLWTTFTTALASILLMFSVLILHYQKCRNPSTVWGSATATASKTVTSNLTLEAPTRSVAGDLTQQQFTIHEASFVKKNEKECASQLKGYHAVTCPVWYNESNPPSNLDPISQNRGIDYRVRYFHKLQNPEGSCMDQNYFTKGFRDMSIFNSFKLLLSRGLYAASLSNRVFVLPERNQFNYCDDRRFESIFEPLSRCSGTHAEALKANGHPYAALKDVTPPLSKLLDKSLRVLDDISEKGIAYEQIFNERERPPFPDLLQFSDKDDLHAGLLLYVLRLNPLAKAKIENILMDVLPCDFEPSRTISLPIRGSDKCRGPMHLGPNNGESDCLEFDVYMQAAELIRTNDPKAFCNTNINNQVDTIILTSEDARYLNYDRSSYTPRWRFVVNNYDIMPSTGLGHSALRTFAQDMNETMDSMLYSALSSFQLQMRGKYFVINCDSGIHQLIVKLATHGGCALAPSPRVYCLQDQVGDLRMCKMFDAKCFQEKYNLTLR